MKTLKGPVVRVGPSDLSFATITAFDTIYGFAGDKNFTIAGSRRNLLVDHESMIDVMLSNCISAEQRRWLRPMVTSTLSDLTGEFSEKCFNVALADALRLHRVGQTESTHIPLSTLNNDFMWELGSLLAFGTYAKKFSRCTSGHFPWMRHMRLGH